MSHINEYGLSSKDYARLYSVWKNLLARCQDEKSDRYYTYGARGIKVCAEWQNFHAFAQFALANGWQPQLSIERRDLDGDYCPENCCFITMAEQMKNRTCNIFITIDGDRKCLTEWCDIFGVPFKTVWARYRVYGITDLDLLFYDGDLRELRTTVLQIASDGTILAKYRRLVDAQNATGANPNAIRNVCRGTRKTAGGYKWKYAYGGIV